MLILKVAAFWLPVLGICGIVGAIEIGTSPVNAVIAFLIGCVVMAVYIRLDNVRYRYDKEIEYFIKKSIEPYAHTNMLFSCILSHEGSNRKGGEHTMGYKICPYCGAHLDPDEQCDCREEEIATSQNENEPAGGNRTSSEQ